MRTGMVGLVIVLAVAAGAAAWTYREAIARVQPAATAAQVAPAGSAVPEVPVESRPAASSDVLYRWVDADGVVHYEQQAGRGVPVTFDGSRITPMAPPPAGKAAQGEAVVADLQRKGSQTLHDLRRDLEEGARRMSENKAASHDF